MSDLGEVNGSENGTCPSVSSSHFPKGSKLTLVDLQELLRAMISPDPAYRISAIQAYHHPALRPTSPGMLITPHFVRAAASMEFEGEPVYLPMPSAHGRPADKKTKKKQAAKKKAGAKGGKENRPSTRAATPALGESIKQHTSLPRFKLPLGEHGDGNAVDPMPSPNRKVVVNSKGLLPQPARKQDEDTTRMYFDVF